MLLNAPSILTALHTLNSNIANKIQHSVFLYGTCSIYMSNKLKTNYNWGFRIVSGVLRTSLKNNLLKETNVVSMGVIKLKQIRILFKNHIYSLYSPNHNIVRRLLKSWYNPRLHTVFPDITRKYSRHNNAFKATTDKNCTSSLNFSSIVKLQSFCSLPS